MSHAARWLVLSFTLAGLTARADADVFKLYGDVNLGGVGGVGLSGDPVNGPDGDTAFFANAPHGVYGLRLGARLLIIDAAIQHHQLTNGARISTWTQFALGIGIQPELGDEKAKKAHTNGFLDIGLNVGFGLGTGQQVDPPLSNDEITDKGFIVEGRLAFGKHLNKVLDLGFVVPASWGYMFKNGFDTAANDVSTHYRSFQVAGLLFLRANLKLL
ncbi:MAG TPA: hypothetical protein VNO30_41050 [Kofleriaceae bacterium]|nr:hypothetical protein [Kofleriaceae bacterium]